MKVKIKKLNENAVIPKYAHSTDAGLDLVATSYNHDVDKNCVIYGTGLAIEIPEGHVGLIFPRSSVRKYDLTMANCVGVIDSGYRGEVMVSFKEAKHIGSTMHCYDLGDKIAQLIIMPYPKIELEEVTELSDSDRGEGGHGSTGN